jgi:hypothetical protein
VVHLPTYDWAHGVSDALENITHSLCTLEFEDHRPLYNWFNERLAESWTGPDDVRQPACCSCRFRSSSSSPGST